MLVSPELTQYIADARASGLSDDVIRQELFKAGWNVEDVNATVPPRIPNSVPAQTQPPVSEELTSKRSRVPFFITVIALLLLGAAVYYFLPQILLTVGKLMGESEPLVPTENTQVNSVPAVSSVKDCGENFDCLIEAAKTCTPAKIDATASVSFSHGVLNPTIIPTTKTPGDLEQTSRTVTEIKGVENGKCVYSIETLEIINPRLTKEQIDEMLKDQMTCSYDSADLVTRLKNVQKGISSFSLSTKDTPEQAARRQCENYGSSSSSSTSTSTINTSGWKTYHNEKYGFEIQYPSKSQLRKYNNEEWFATEGEPCISFGTKTSRIGGYIWGLCIYNSDKFDFEAFIARIGDQFPDREQKRQSETIAGFDATSITTTTNTHPDWISRHIFISKGSKIYEFSNGAEQNSEFDSFLSTFKFIPQATSTKP